MQEIEIDFNRINEIIPKQEVIQIMSNLSALVEPNESIDLSKLKGLTDEEKNQN